MTKSTMLKKAAAVATAAATSLGMFAIAAPVAFAAVNSSSITITTTNRGTIDNTTKASSHTGENIALGSVGGEGAKGGKITSDGANNNGGATSGAGGNGGNGGAGGLVQTGNADASALTANDLNNTDAGVALGTSDVNSTSIDVPTDNSAPDNLITNVTRAKARSGDNTAKGSVGGDAGKGGKITGGTGDFNNGGATSGAGGNGGSAGLGGTILTGNATSHSGTINMLNTVFVRVSTM